MVHGWPINRPWNYQPLKEKNSCLSLLGLIHKSGIWISWVSSLKKWIIHLPYTVDRAEAQETWVPKKSLCQTVNIEKSPCQVKVYKKLSPCPLKGIKNLSSQRVKLPNFQIVHWAMQTKMALTLLWYKWTKAVGGRRTPFQHGRSQIKCMQTKVRSEWWRRGCQDGRIHRCQLSFKSM